MHESRKQHDKAQDQVCFLFSSKWLLLEVPEVRVAQIVQWSWSKSLSRNNTQIMPHHQKKVPFTIFQYRRQDNSEHAHWPLTPRAGAGLNLDQGGFGRWCKNILSFHLSYFYGLESTMSKKPQHVYGKCVCVLKEWWVVVSKWMLGFFLRLHP